MQSTRSSAPRMRTTRSASRRHALLVCHSGYRLPRRCAWQASFSKEQVLARGVWLWSLPQGPKLWGSTLEPVGGRTLGPSRQVFQVTVFVA